MLAACYLVAAYGFIFLPVVVLILFSFQDGLLPVPPFKGPSLEWYDRMLANERLLESLVNSFFVAVVSSAACTALGFLAAYGLARRPMRLAGFIRFLLMAPLMVSYLIIGMGLLVAFHLANVPKSLFTVGIGHVVINLPLCFAIALSQLGEHQRNIERAAHDLGASEWQSVILVTVPILRPALMAAFLLSVTLSWNEFIIAFLLSRFDVTLPVMIYEMLRAGLNPETNAAGTMVFAISIFAVLAAMIVMGRRGRHDG